MAVHVKGCQVLGIFHGADLILLLLWQFAIMCEAARRRFSISNSQWERVACPLQVVEFLSQGDELKCQGMMEEEIHTVDAAECRQHWSTVVKKELSHKWQLSLPPHLWSKKTRPKWPKMSFLCRVAEPSSPGWSGAVALHSHWTHWPFGFGIPIEELKEVSGKCEV